MFPYQLAQARPHNVLHFLSDQKLKVGRAGNEALHPPCWSCEARSKHSTRAWL